MAYFVQLVTILFIVLTCGRHSVHGGIKETELAYELPLVRQIRFGALIQTNDIGASQNIKVPGPKISDGNTGIYCSTPGIFVSAPDGCNRCYCGGNGELTHRCTRAYCPPGFPSGGGGRRFYQSPPQTKNPFLSSQRL